MFFFFGTLKIIEVINDKCGVRVWGKCGPVNTQIKLKAHIEIEFKRWTLQI